MKLKFTVFIILIATLLFNSYSIDINIEGHMTEYSTIYEESVKITLNCNEDILVKTPIDAYDISINDRSTENSSIFVNNCQNNTIISYKSDTIEDLGKDKYRLEKNFNNYHGINLTYSLSVPLEYALDANNSYPLPIKTDFDNSKKILSFDASNLYVLYFDKIELEQNDFSTSHFKEELTEISVLFLMIVSFLVGAIATYFYMDKKLKDAPQTQVPSYILSKENKDVLDVVKQTPGINQKQIANKLDFSKSRVSAIISDLEEKQLIRREKFGRSYKVYLNKKIV